MYVTLIPGKEIPMHERTPTAITAIDLSAWEDHANRLTFAAKFFALAVASSPCQCGDCSHCQELASLDIDIRTSARHAAEGNAPRRPAKASSIVTEGKDTGSDRKNARRTSFRYRHLAFQIVAKAP
jgi:hypothetical protein